MENNADYTIQFVEVLQNGQKSSQMLRDVCLYSRLKKTKDEFSVVKRVLIGRWHNGISEMLTVYHLSCVLHASGYWVINK